jgi:hypothetical protein
MCQTTKTKKNLTTIDPKNANERKKFKKKLEMVVSTPFA